MLVFKLLNAIKISGQYYKKLSQLARKELLADFGHLGIEPLYLTHEFAIWCNVFELCFQALELHG